MELAKVIAAIMEALHSDSEAIVVFDETESKGIQSITFYSDDEDGLTAHLTAATGTGERDFKSALGLVVYHSRAITEII